MARPKPAWRRVLNARQLRWRALTLAVAAAPPLGRWIGFFPRGVSLPEGADRVLADQRRAVPSDEIAPDMPFLRLCARHDSRAPGAELPGGVVTGRRTAIYRRPWIDLATSAILLPDRRATVLFRGDTVNRNAARPRPGRRPLCVEGRVFAPFPTRNYFHMLLENGVRLIDLLDSGLIAEAPLTVVKQRDRGAVEAALWRGVAALYPGLAVRHFPDGALVQPDEAVAHFPPDTYWEWPPVTRVQADRLGAAFDAVYGEAAAARGPDKLYLSRAGSKLREPVNAAALEAALTARGFATLTASDINHADQIARFRAARTIVAVHGAGLTNLLFCAPGATVVEIFPANFVKSPYRMLARRLGLNHVPVIAGPGDYDQRFEIDPNAVLAALDATPSAPGSTRAP